MNNPKVTMFYHHNGGNVVNPIALQSDGENSYLSNGEEYASSSNYGNGSKFSYG